MLYEIRNYHFKPDLLDAYKTWAKTEALPYISQQLDVVGFWTNTGDESEISGDTQDPFGSANITWIIRWKDLVHRNEVWPLILSAPEWQDIFSRVPGGPASYRRVEAKFAESLC